MKMVRDTLCKGSHRQLGAVDFKMVVPIFMNFCYNSTLCYQSVLKPVCSVCSFYLPKMQHSREAAVWNAVFERAQDNLGVPRGSIKATVLIETLPAVFQMHEILYELRQHSAGQYYFLNTLRLFVMVPA